MVDAEDLGLVEHRQHLAVQLERLVPTGAEGLLDHHADLGPLVPVEAVLAQLADDHGEELRRRRQIEDAVERDPGLIVEAAQLAYYHRAKMNSAARSGLYAPEQETAGVA